MQVITSAELKDKMDAHDPITIVDVREADEHAAFNIGGILLPLGKIAAMQIEEIDEFKNNEVICYCRSGKRSMQACLMLETFGFTNVKNLAGGMLEWEENFNKSQGL